MQVTHLRDAATFLARTAAFRASEPVLSNVISTVTEGVVAGREYESVHWWIIEDSAPSRSDALSQPQVLGVAMRTAPFNLVLSPMPQLAAQALSDSVREVFAQLPGVSAPKDVGEDFLSAYFASVAHVSVRMHDVIRVLDTFTPARGIPGAVRAVTEADRPLLHTWMRHFAEDAGVHAFGIDAAVVALLERGWLWQDAGQPVSVCGHTPVTGTVEARVVRVGPVFTPEEFRGHGYASAVTSHVISLLQPQAEILMLYADANNPTSNGVYERLGMPVVDEILEWELSYSD